MTAVRAWTFLFAAAAVAFPAAAGPEDGRPARVVSVASPGWVRISLDTGGLLLGQPDGRWRILDAAGQPVPHWVMRSRVERLTVRPARVEPGPAGWTLVFDLGARPVRHGKLVLEPVRPLAARGFTLEGSDDGSRWTPLASDTLFHLGAATPAGRGGALSYAAAAWRFLRLFWPRDAGFPELSGAYVETRPGAGAPLPPLPLPVKPADAAGAFIVNLPSGGLPASRLLLDWEPSVPESYRLLEAHGARWVAPAFGASLAGGEGRRATIDVEPPSLAAPVLLVESESGARLVAAYAELAPPELLFQAGTAGTYRLFHALPEESAGVEGVPEGFEGGLVDIVPGAGTSLPWPALPENVTRAVPIAALPRDSTSWWIDGGGARPGDVVRVEVADALRASPGPSRGGLRVMVDRAVLPCAMVEAEEPAPVEPPFAPEARSSPEGGRVFSFPLDGAASLLTEISLRPAEARPFEASVSLAWRVGRHPGPDETLHGGSGGWTCAPGATPSCTLRLALSPPAGAAALEVTASARRNTVLPEPLGFKLYRGRPALIFAWPAAGEPRLVSGFEPGTVGGALAAEAARLAARPWHSARLRPETTAQERAAPEQKSRLALTVALIGAAAVLLFLLGRALGHPSRG